MIALEEHLIKSGPIIERPKGGLQALDSIVASRVVKAFVINPANSQSATEVAGFGEEGVLIPEAVEVNLRLKRSSLLPFLRDLLSLEHGASQT